jgi:hypothetical protein
MNRSRFFAVWGVPNSLPAFPVFPVVHQIYGNSYNT